ncbi:MULTISPECIES: nuclear transport factor 2 family protein [unclassified Streptomyces]|uniref:nuclear transport factor 2 family protein n=1 Tax=unclassified Streptomyces TaxID=2593676 RepID=UPI0038103573
MRPDRIRISPTSGTATAAGVRHVMLTYHYLDIGDTDGYASLTERDLILDHPGAAPHRGRDAVVSLHAAQAQLLRRHELTAVVADEDMVVALGRVVRSATGDDGRGVHSADFADVFTLSEQTLVKTCRRYYYALPPGPSGPLFI